MENKRQYTAIARTQRLLSACATSPSPPPSPSITSSAYNTAARNNPCNSTAKPTDLETPTPRALLRPREIFKLGSFNVRTLSQPGQQAGLARTMEFYQLDVCCLSETRLQDSSNMIHLASPANTDTRFHLRLSGDPAAAAAGLAGVGIALSHRAEAALLDWIPIDSRLCAVRLKGSCKVSRSRNDTYNLFIVSAYAPTDISSDVIKDQFYQNLHNLLRAASKRDIIIIAGDLNARVGRLSPNEKHLGGHHGLDHVRTDNGNRLLSLCSDHQLFLASTNFRHSKTHSATWRPPSNTQDWAQIDHVAISHRWRGSVQDCRSHWSTYVDSDHALLFAKICMQFTGAVKHSHNKLNISELTDPVTRQNYQIALSKKLSSPSPTDIDEHWSHLQNALTLSCQETCGFTHRTVKNWLSARSLELLNRRQRIPPGLEYHEDRRLLSRELKVSIRHDRRNWWSERAAEMEAAHSSGDMRKLFQLIRATGVKTQGISELINEEDGSPITSRQRRLERWAEHFSHQFNQPPAPTTPASISARAQWEVPLEPPTEAEIRWALTHLKRFKAAGPDNIPPALLKDGGNVVIKELLSLFSKVWLTERVPLNWGESIVIPVFKKGARTLCSNYRGISLISIASKLLASIILRRLSPAREKHCREEQAGFRSNRGCIDQIFTLRQILEHRHVYQRPTCVVFLDIKAAFDALDRSALWTCLKRNGVPEKFITILQGLYRHTSGKVRAYNQLSPPFATLSGVRQGCPISPFLFNFIMDSIFQDTLEGTFGYGVELLPGNRVVDLEYADDIALLGEDAESVQCVLDRLVIEATKYGLHFAPSKSKVMLQDWDGPAPTLKLAGDRLETVDCFKYLGSSISTGGSAESEITSRVSKARLVFSNLKHLWRRRDISLQLKGRVYKTTVRAVLLYGCETWPLRADDLRKLTAFDNRCLRNIARVWWEHRISNDEVRRRVFGAGDRTVEQTISLQRLRWLGHVLRMPPDRLPRRALFALPGNNWKKRYGGQPMTWRRGMRKLTEKLASVGRSRLPGWGAKDDNNVWLETLELMARARSQWRECCNAIL